MRRVLGGLVFLLLIAPMVPAAAAEEEAKPKVREVATWRAREIEKARYGWIVPFWKKHAAVNKDGRCTSAARCEGEKWGYYGPAGKPGLEPHFSCSAF